MNEQKFFNTLWVVVPAMAAVAMSAHARRVQVVARGLATTPVALATDRPPASADGFCWETRSTATERAYRAPDGRQIRVNVGHGVTLLWCREVGGAIYSLAGHGPDRFGPPCVIDPPFVLRRQAVSGGAVQTLRADLPTPSVFVMPSGTICYGAADGVHQTAPDGKRDRLICRRADRDITAWGAAGEKLYWIEEATPGGRDPVGSCRIEVMAPGDRQPRTIAWAPDALTDLVVSGKTIAWYHPAGRALEGMRPDGQVGVLAREINLAETPVAIGGQLIYLCEESSGIRTLRTLSPAQGGSRLIARLDRSARLLGTAGDGLYLGEEEGNTFWLPNRPPTGRLLRVPLGA